MFCTNCGSQNPDGATACSSCGMAFGNPYQASQVGPGYNAPGMRPDIPTYLVQSILVTLFCCLPFGIVAIVFAAKVNGRIATGDFEGARNASNSAKTWCLVSFIIGLIFVVIRVVMIMGQLNH